MKFQTDRCMTCGSPARPSNLKSKYTNEAFGTLDNTGKFSSTDYWFCSDECYEKAFSEYMEKEYLPEYLYENKNKPFAPNLTKAMKEVAHKCVEEHWYYLEECSNTEYERFLKEELVPKMRNQQIDLYNEWLSNQLYASDMARIDLKKRIEDEYWYQYFKNEEEFLKQDDKEQEAIRREVERLTKEGERMEERKRREEERLEEKRRRDEDRAQREQERLAREEEKRRKEQEKLDEQRRLEEERLQRMMPRQIPDEARFEHTHIIGGSGAGKSTLIIKSVMEDIARRGDPAIVVIDPKGTLVDRLARFRPFEPDYYSRYRPNPLVLIDPTKYAPSLNMFAPPRRGYDKKIAEQIENNTISLFQYIFSSKDAKLTDKQLTCFSYCVKLLFTISGATIETLLELLKDPSAGKTGGIRPDSRFKPYINNLDPISKQFFLNYFYDPTEYGATKDQIATRILGMLRYTAFQNMFLNQESKLDMFEMLQSGKVVLVSCPQAVLGAEGAQLFARYMVALTLQAAYERLTIPRNTWRPAYLYIDEAQEVVDEVKTQSLLQQAREFKLGVTIAHQQIRGQISESIFSTISANTRIKYAATRSYADASAMAKDMRCEPEFIMNQQKVDGKAHFACFCDGVTPHPFSLELDLSEINSFDQMNEADYHQLIEEQETTYGSLAALAASVVLAAERRFGKLGPLIVRPPSPQTDFQRETSSPPRKEEKPQATQLRPTAPPSISKPAADPHTGDHTKPASKWGDS